MIVNDRITDYIQSLETSQGPVLDEIEKEALDQFVPKGDGSFFKNHDGSP